MQTETVITQKKKVVANRSGWVFTPGNPNSGNDNKGAQPEVLVCSRNLQKSIDVPTPTHITLGSTTDKTAFFPDGDTFTGAASSSLGDVTAYIYFNEPIHVTTHHNLQVKQATALGSNFGTIMDFNSSVSVLSEGIINIFTTKHLKTLERQMLRTTHWVSTLMMQSL